MDVGYPIEPGKAMGGGDHGAPIPMPRTEHGDDFVKDHAVGIPGPSQVQPVGSGS